MSTSTPSQLVHLRIEAAIGSSLALLSSLIVSIGYIWLGTDLSASDLFEIRRLSSPTWLIPASIIMAAIFPARLSTRLLRGLLAGMITWASWSIWLWNGVHLWMTVLPILVPISGLSLTTAALVNNIRWINRRGKPLLQIRPGLQELERQLPEWRKIRHTNWPPYSLHLRGPQGQEITLHCIRGIERGLPGRGKPAGQKQAIWIEPSPDPRHATWPGGALMWIQLRSQQQYPRTIWPAGNGSTVIGSAQQVAQAIRELSTYPSGQRAPIEQMVTTAKPASAVLKEQLQVSLAEKLILPKIMQQLQQASESWHISDIKNRQVQCTSASGTELTILIWPHPGNPHEVIYQQAWQEFKNSMNDAPDLAWAPLGNASMWGPQLLESPTSQTRWSTRSALGVMKILEEIESDRKPTQSPRAILGLPENATHEEVRRAWRRLIKRYHPDRVSQEHKAWAQEKTSEFNAAYESIMSESS